MSTDDTPAVERHREALEKLAEIDEDIQLVRDTRKLLADVEDGG